MGLLIQNNQIILSDAAGNQRFTTNKRMPHLMFAASGTIGVPNVIGTSVYVAGTGYAGSPTAQWTSTSADYTQDFSVITNAAVQDSNSFIFPFFTIVGGDVDTGGAAITGSGSIMLRVFVDGAGFYRGASILTPVVIGNSVVLRIRSTIYDEAGELVAHPPVAVGTPISGQANTVELTNTGYTIGYRLYYGRFS